MKYKFEINHLLEAVSSGYVGIVFRKYNREFPKKDKGRRAAFYRESKKLLVAIQKMLAARVALSGNSVQLPKDKKEQLLAQINEKIAFYAKNGLNIAINGLPKEISLEYKDLSIDGFIHYVRDEERERGLVSVDSSDELLLLEEKAYDLSVKLDKLDKKGHTPIKRKGRKMKAGGGYKRAPRDNKTIDFTGKAVQNEAIVAGNALQAMFYNYVNEDISLVLNEI